MPKVPTYTLVWSPTIEVYELYETRDHEVLGIVPDSPEWFAWLDQVSSFAFSGKSGHCTARKETKQRGDFYWYAYLARGTHLIKKYLGKTSDLTLARLEHLAGLLTAGQTTSVQPRQETPFLSAQSEAQPPLPASPRAGTDGAVATAHPPLLVQQPPPLHPFLLTKLHVPRPRPLLVPRSHLVERLQQGV